MEVRVSSEGYSVGGTKISSLSELPGAVRAQKKPIAIIACKIEEPFQIETAEGSVKGKAGDWLMQGVSGELYICPAEIFKKSYDVIKG